MAKKTKEITTVDDNLNNAMITPEFMREDSKVGTELLSKFMQPPRIKVIQPLTKPPLIDMFNPGDMVILPTNQVILTLAVDDKGKTLKTSAPVRFTPIFFFPEWITYNPKEIKEQHGSIRERTFDENSPIAFKSKNKATRTEPCPEMADKLITHVEVLNYAVVFYIDDIPTEPAILQFKSGEHSVGTAFNTLIRSRKAPIFGCVFEATIGFRTNSKGQWFGVDVSNPQERPWVSDSQMYAAFKEEHERFQEFYDANAIIIEDDDDASSGVVDADSSEM